MKLIYRANGISEAHIISGLLKSNGIEAHVGGHYLQGGIGELAAMGFATVNVADKNVKAATRVIAEYENNNNPLSENNNSNKSIFTTPLIVLSITILVMLLLAIAFSDYQ